METTWLAKDATPTDKWKRYLFSSAVTFITGFAIALVPLLDTLTYETFATDMWKSAVVGIVLTAVRAGVKAVSEQLTAYMLNRQG